MERIVILDGGLPWGFRIQGGADTGLQLRVARVNPGSKAALLGIREGDVIASINGNQTEQLSNTEAHQLLKGSGSHLKLTLTQGNTLSRKVFKSSANVDFKNKKGATTNGTRPDTTGATTAAEQSNSQSTSSHGCNTDLQQNGSIALEEALSTSPTTPPRPARRSKKKSSNHISWDCTKHSSESDPAEDVYLPLQDPNGEARRSFIDSMLTSATSSLARRRSAIVSQSSKFVTFQSNENEPLMESLPSDHIENQSDGMYTNQNFHHDAQLPCCDIFPTKDVLRLHDITTDSTAKNEPPKCQEFNPSGSPHPAAESIIEILNDIEYQILHTGRTSTFSPKNASWNGEISGFSTPTLDSSHNAAFEDSFELVNHEKAETSIATLDLINDPEPLNALQDTELADAEPEENSESEVADPTHGISIEELAEFMQFLGLLKQRQNEFVDHSQLGHSTPEREENDLTEREDSQEVFNAGKDLADGDEEDEEEADTGTYVLEVMENEGSELTSVQNVFLRRFLHVIPEEGSELSDSKRSSRALSEMSEMTVHSQSLSLNWKGFPGVHTPTLTEDPVNLEAPTHDDPESDWKSLEIFERYSEIHASIENIYEPEVSNNQSNTKMISPVMEIHTKTIQVPVDEETDNLVELNEEVDESCLPITVADLNSSPFQEEVEESSSEPELKYSKNEDVVDEFSRSSPTANATTTEPSFNELDTILQEIMFFSNLAVKSPSPDGHPSEQEADSTFPNEPQEEAKLETDVEGLGGYAATNCLSEANTKRTDAIKETPIVVEANQANLIEDPTITEQDQINTFLTGAETININKSLVTLVESPLSILSVVSLLIGPATNAMPSPRSVTRSSSPTLSPSSVLLPNTIADQNETELERKHSFCRSLLNSATARLLTNATSSMGDLTTMDAFQCTETVEGNVNAEAVVMQTHSTPVSPASSRQTLPRIRKRSAATIPLLPNGSGKVLSRSEVESESENESSKLSSFQLAKQRLLALANPAPINTSAGNVGTPIRAALVNELKQYWSSKEASHSDLDTLSDPGTRSFSVPRLDDLVLEFLFRADARGATDVVVNLLYQLVPVLPPKLTTKIRARYGRHQMELKGGSIRGSGSITGNKKDTTTMANYQACERKYPLPNPQRDMDVVQECGLNEEHVLEHWRETEEMSMSDKYFYDAETSPEGYYWLDNDPRRLNNSLYHDSFAYQQQYVAPPVPPLPYDVMYCCSNVSYDPRELAKASFSMQPALANETSAFYYAPENYWDDRYRHDYRVSNDFGYDTYSLSSLPPPPRPPPPEDEWSDSEGIHDVMSYPPTTGIPPRPPLRGRQASYPSPPVRTASMDKMAGTPSANMQTTNNCDRKRHSSYEGFQSNSAASTFGKVTEEKERLKATLLSDWLLHARKSIVRPLSNTPATGEGQSSDYRNSFSPLRANLEPESYLTWRSDSTLSCASGNVIAPNLPQRFLQNHDINMARPVKAANNTTSPRPVSYLEFSSACTAAPTTVTTSSNLSKQRPRSFHELEMEEEARSYAMMQEYQDRLAQRAHRKQNGVIKVSNPVHPLPRPPPSTDLSFGSDFADRLKQRRDQLGTATDDEFEAIMREEVQRELATSTGHPWEVPSSGSLPQRLLEDSALFLSPSTEDEDGVWSPGQSQPPSNRNEFSTKTNNTGVGRAEEKDKAEATPIWTPPTVRSPSLERKEFRPVRLDTNSLKKQPSQEREKAAPVLASQTYQEESNYQWLTREATSTAATTPASETSRFLDSSRPTSTTPGTPSVASSFTLQSSWSHRAPSSSTLSTPAVTPTSHLPRAPNATVTLLQKAREGQLPKGSAYLEANEEKFRSSQEKLFTIKREYESEDEQRRKIVELTPKKFSGIGPTSQEGIPLALRTGVEEENQHQWYRRMYDSLHRAGKPDDYVTVRYKTRGRYPYGGGYQSEPEPYDYNYDSDVSFNAGRYNTLDRRRNAPNLGSRPGFQDVYRNQPGRIEDFEPGRSSVSEKENKQWWDEVMGVFDRAVKSIPTRSFTSFALKESGYESDSQLVFRRKSEQDTSSTATPLEQRTWYRDIQKGGDVPLHGLRKPAPDRPQEREIDEAQLAFYQALLHRNQFEFEEHSMQNTYYPPLFQEPPPYIPPPPPPERAIRSAYDQPPQPPQRRSSAFSSTLRKLNFTKKFSKIMASSTLNKATAVFYTTEDEPSKPNDNKKSTGKEASSGSQEKDVRTQSLPNISPKMKREDPRLSAVSISNSSKPPKKPTRELKTVLTRSKLFRSTKDVKQSGVRRSSSISSASTPSSPRSPKLNRPVRSLSTSRVEKKEYSDDTSALVPNIGDRNGFLNQKNNSQTTTIVSSAKLSGTKAKSSTELKEATGTDKTIEIVVKYSPKALQVLHSTPYKSVALTTTKSPSPAHEMMKTELTLDRKSSVESRTKSDPALNVVLRQKRSVVDTKFRRPDTIPANKENGVSSARKSANSEKLARDTKLIVARLSTGEIPSPQKIRHVSQTPLRSLVEQNQSMVAASTHLTNSEPKTECKSPDLTDPNFSCDEATAAILLAELENNHKPDENGVGSSKRSTSTTPEPKSSVANRPSYRPSSVERTPRRESHEYRHYVSELRHSSPKSDRFSQLKSLYTSLERLNQLEKTASCSDLHKLSSEGVIDFEMWRKLRSREKAEEELRTLKLCIVQAQKQGECMFSTKESGQLKWKGDSGLRIKKASVDLLREKFEVESNTSLSPPCGSARGENKDSYRSLWRADSVHEVAHKYQKRDRLSRSQSLKTHFGRNDPRYTSLSLEQINSLKGRLNQLYGSKVASESHQSRLKSPSPSAQRRYEVLVTETSNQPKYRSNSLSRGYQDELYVRSNSDKDKNTTYEATLQRQASLRQGKALSISSVNQTPSLSEAEKRQLSKSLSQEVKQKYLQQHSRRTPPKRSSSLGATTRNALSFPKSSTSAAVTYVRNLSQKLADNYRSINPPSRLSNSSYESDQSYRSDFMLVLTPQPAQAHAFSDVEDAVREWAQQSKRTSLTRSSGNTGAPLSVREQDYGSLDWFQADDASSSSNSSAQTVIDREVSNKVKFFEEKIARAQSPTPSVHDKGIKVYRSVSDLKDHLLYKTSVTSLSSSVQPSHRRSSGGRSLTRTQSLPRKLTYTQCNTPGTAMNTPNTSATTSSNLRLSLSDAKKNSNDDSWESSITDGVFATLPNRKRKSNMNYFTSDYLPEKCVSSMDIASNRAPPTPPPFPSNTPASISKSMSMSSTPDNSRSYNRSYLALVKAGDVNQKRKLFNESAVRATSVGSSQPRTGLRRQSSLPTVARNVLKQRVTDTSQVTVKGQEKGDVRYIKRKYEDVQRPRRSLSLKSSREIMKPPSPRSSSLRDASVPRKSGRSNSSPLLDSSNVSDVDRLREKFEHLSERRARLEERSSYRSLFSSVPSLGAETSPLPTLNWAKRFGTPREIKRGSEHQKDTKRKHVSFPNNLDQFDPPSSPSQTSSSSRRSSNLLVKPTLLSAARMAYLQAKNSVDNGTNFKFPPSRKNSPLRNINIEPVRLSRRDSLQEVSADRKDSFEEASAGRKESTQSVESTESAKSERMVLPGIDLLSEKKVQKEMASAAKPKLSLDSTKSAGKGDDRRLATAVFDPSMHRPKSRYTPVPDFLVQSGANFNTFPRSKRSISVAAPPSRPPPPVDLAFSAASASRTRSSSSSLVRSMSMREPPSQYANGSYGAEWNGTTQGANHRFAESQVNIHYKSPIRNLQQNSREEDEEEMRQRQAEHMRRVYEHERRRKYLQELQDIEMRRHTDNFTPLQKSPIPLNRYDDFMEEQTRGVSRERERTPEPKVVARALYNFVALNARELSFQKGDIIFVRRQIDKNWYEGEHNALVGIFPVNYVEIIPYDNVRVTSKKPSEGQARAKYNFVAHTPMELSLVKGELVLIIRQIDDRWLEGRIGNRKGIFPANYVDIIAVPSEKSMVNASKPVSHPASHSLITNGTLRNYRTSYSVQNQSNHEPMPRLGAGRVVRSTPPPPPAAMNTSLHIDTHTDPIVYKPQNDDELELEESDIVSVLEKCDDGWYVGTSQRTGQFGTFPGNYVERV